jgi:hypothetical protein
VSGVGSREAATSRGGSGRKKPFSDPSTAGPPPPALPTRLRRSPLSHFKPLPRLPLPRPRGNSMDNWRAPNSAIPPLPVPENLDANYRRLAPTHPPATITPISFFPELVLTNSKRLSSSPETPKRVYFAEPRELIPVAKGAPPPKLPFFLRK